MVVGEMFRVGLPWPMVLLMMLLAWTDNIPHGKIRYADFFSGEGEQSKAFYAAGLQGHSHDICHGAELSLATA